MLAALTLPACHEDPTHTDIVGAHATAPRCAELADLDCAPEIRARQWRFDYAGASRLAITGIVTLDDPTPIEGWLLTTEACVDPNYARTLVDEYFDLDTIVDYRLARVIRHQAAGGFTHITRPAVESDDYTATTCPLDSLTATRRYTVRDGHHRLERWPPTPPE